MIAADRLLGKPPQAREGVPAAALRMKGMPGEKRNAGWGLAAVVHAEGYFGILQADRVGRAVEPALPAGLAALYVGDNGLSMISV